MDPAVVRARDDGVVSSDAAPPTAETRLRSSRGSDSRRHYHFSAFIYSFMRRRRPHPARIILYVIAEASGRQNLTFGPTAASTTAVSTGFRR